jgi:hypothetical protein
MNKLDELIAYADRYGERPEPEPIEMTKQERLDKIKFLKNKLGLTKSKTKKSKEYKESNIMKGRSDLKKKGDKYEVETELNIKEGLEPKVKRALKKSIIDETNKKIKNYKKPVGFGMRGGMVELDDSSSSEEDEPKKKIDKKELMNYAKMLAHLLGHIEDPREPIDKKDYRDAKKLIDDMEKVKGKGIKGIKGRGDRPLGKTPDKYLPKPQKIVGPVVAEHGSVKNFERRRGLTEKQEIENRESKERIKDMEFKTNAMLMRNKLGTMEHEVRGIDRTIDKSFDKVNNLLDRVISGELNDLTKEKKVFDKEVNNLFKKVDELPGYEIEKNKVLKLGVEPFRDPFQEYEEAIKEQREMEHEDIGRGLKRKRGRPRKNI